MQEQKRLIVFDLCKLFAIFLVLWGHSIQSFVSIPYSEDHLWKILQSFHMPLFMIIAGYFARKSLELDFGPFIRKKFTQLLLPCITWGVLIFVIRNCVSDQGFSLIETIYGNFWFLKSVFISYLLAWASYRIEKYIHVQCLGVILCILISLFLPQFNVIRLFPCFIFGIILRKNRELFFAKNRRWLRIAVSLLLYIVCFSLDHYSDWVYGSISSFWADISLFQSFAIGYICRIVMGITASLCIIIGFYSLFSSSQYGNGILSRIAELGSLTLGIYIIQTYLLEKALAAVINLDSLNYWLSYFLVMPAISMLVIWICTLIIKVMYRNKWLALFFYGKTFQK